ncbi:MAG TPA: hypothetical protein VGW34_15495 [Allosphingosinicella sp.]|nr:hypothetical protein [Allosphingosinicella sp.]
MPSYHFNIEGGELGEDREGTDLRDLATAKCEAAKLLGRVLCDSADTFWDRQELSVIVTDETKLVLFTLNLFATEAPATLRIYPMVSA